MVLFYQEIIFILNLYSFVILVGVESCEESKSDSHQENLNEVTNTVLPIPTATLESMLECNWSQHLALAVQRFAR